ncbi:hypothetical protein ACTA71_009679 [Dictyostelium dimigraforme]
MESDTEILFWKVFNNKYLFNLIFQHIRNFYNHSYTDLDGNCWFKKRKLFKNIYLFKWFIDNQQFKLLLYKLNNGEYIKVNKESVFAFKHYFDSKISRPTQTSTSTSTSNSTSNSTSTSESLSSTSLLFKEILALLLKNNLIKHHYFQIFKRVTSLTIFKLVLESFEETNTNLPESLKNSVGKSNEKSYWSKFLTDNEEIVDIEKDIHHHSTSALENILSNFNFKLFQLYLSTIKDGRNSNNIKNLEFNEEFLFNRPINFTKDMEFLKLYLSQNIIYEVSMDSFIINSIDTKQTYHTILDLINSNITTNPSLENRFKSLPKTWNDIIMKVSKGFIAKYSPKVILYKDRDRVYKIENVETIDWLFNNKDYYVSLRISLGSLEFVQYINQRLFGNDDDDDDDKDDKTSSSITYFKRIGQHYGFETVKVFNCEFILYSPSLLEEICQYDMDSLERIDRCYIIDLGSITEKTTKETVRAIVLLLFKRIKQKKELFRDIFRSFVYSEMSTHAIEPLLDQIEDYPIFTDPTGFTEPFKINYQYGYISLGFKKENVNSIIYIIEILIKYYIKVNNNNNKNNNNNNNNNGNNFNSDKILVYENLIQYLFDRLIKASNITNDQLKYIHKQITTNNIIIKHQLYYSVYYIARKSPISIIYILKFNNINKRIFIDFNLYTFDRIFGSSEEYIFQEIINRSTELLNTLTLNWLSIESNSDGLENSKEYYSKVLNFKLEFYLSSNRVSLFFGLLDSIQQQLNDITIRIGSFPNQMEDCQNYQNLQYEKEIMKRIVEFCTRIYFRNPNFSYDRDFYFRYYGKTALQILKETHSVQTSNESYLFSPSTRVTYELFDKPFYRYKDQSLHPINSKVNSNDDDNNDDNDVNRIYKMEHFKNKNLDEIEIKNNNNNNNNYSFISKFKDCNDNCRTGLNEIINGRIFYFSTKVYNKAIKLLSEEDFKDFIKFCSYQSFIQFLNSYGIKVKYLLRYYDLINHILLNHNNQYKRNQIDSDSNNNTDIEFISNYWDSVFKFYPLKQTTIIGYQKIVKSYNINSPIIDQLFNNYKLKYNNQFYQYKKKIDNPNEERDIPMDYKRNKYDCIGRQDHDFKSAKIIKK